MKCLLPQIEHIMIIDDWCQTQKHQLRFNFDTCKCKLENSRGKILFLVSYMQVEDDNPILLV